MKFIVTAPARYQVVSNGLLRRGDGPRRRPAADALEAVGPDRLVAERRWASPSSPRIMPAWSRGSRSRRWVYHQDRAAVVPALGGPARRVLEFYSEHIGPYPYEKLAGVQAAGRQRRDGARQRDLLRRAHRSPAGAWIAWSPTRSPTSGSATPSPSATGTTSGSARASRPISPCCSSSTTTAATPSWPA